MNVLVYRPDLSAVDRHGDPIDSSGNVIRQESPGTYLGTLDVVLADPDVSSLSTGVDTDTAAGGAQARGVFSAVQALVGAPTGASIILEHGDILVTDEGASLFIGGPRTYGRPNAITGQPVKINGVAYYWLRAFAVV